MLGSELCPKFSGGHSGRKALAGGMFLSRGLEVYLF